MHTTSSPAAAACRPPRDWPGAPAAGPGMGGSRSRLGTSPEPGLGSSSLVLSPRPRGAPALTRQPRALGSCPAGRAARSGHPIPEPPPAARAPTPSQRRPRGRAARAVRPLPLSLWIPLIRGLSAAPRLPGCRGRPAGVLETVPSLSPFIKRPWAALKQRSQ